MSQPQYTPQPNSQELADAALPHLLGIFSVVGAFIGWQINKDKSPRADYEGKKALNFQITVLIAYVVISFFWMFIPFGSALIGLLWIANLIFCILAYQAVRRGEDYKYPFSLFIVK